MSVRTLRGDSEPQDGREPWRQCCEDDAGQNQQSMNTYMYKCYVRKGIIVYNYKIERDKKAFRHASREGGGVCA